MAWKKSFPKGNVTFLFYDCVGSSKAALSLDYATYRQDMLGRLYSITEDVVSRHHGKISGSAHGDDCLAVFEKASDAVQCAVDLQEQVGSISVTDKDGIRLEMPLINLTISRCTAIWILTPV